MRKFPQSNHSCVLQKNSMCCQEISNFFHTTIFFCLRNCLKVGLRQREATHTNLHGRQARASVMQELSWLRGICVLGGGGVGLLIPIHLWGRVLIGWRGNGWCLVDHLSGHFFDFFELFYKLYAVQRKCITCIFRAHQFINLCITIGKYNM